MSTAVMRAFVAHALGIFGDTWDLMCELHGVANKQTRNFDDNHVKLHGAFLSSLAWHGVQIDGD